MPIRTYDYPTPLKEAQLLESFRRLVDILRRQDIRTPYAPSATGYTTTVTTASESRTMTASTATASGVAIVLSTLINDLKRSGHLA